MEAMAIKETAEIQSSIQSVSNHHLEEKAHVLEQKSAIQSKVDQVYISAAALNSQIPAESDVPAVEVKNPVKEMFLNADDYQQVELVQGQITKNQLEAYAEYMQNASGDEKTEPKIIEIAPKPSLYDKAVEAYKVQNGISL